MMSSENPVQLQTAYEGCFTFTPNDLNELLSFFDSKPESGSDDPNRNPIQQTDNNKIKERKLRRMISNRLSARRSRWRKKRHLEDIAVQFDKLKVQNRDFKTRLGLVKCQCHVVNRENERLRFESMLLKQRLADLYRSLLAIQLQNNHYLYNLKMQSNG